jgi:hypothetical protein
MHILVRLFPQSLLARIVLVFLTDANKTAGVQQAYVIYVRLAGVIELVARFANQPNLLKDEEKKVFQSC